VPIVRKKRRDAVTLFSEGRQLAEAVLREATGRAERLTLGLAALWPAPLTASLLVAPEEGQLSVGDEAGRPRPDWHGVLRPQLTQWLQEASLVRVVPAPIELGLADHFLHGSVIGWDSRRYGALALALHKRTADAALAQALLAHLADHLASRLSREETDRQAQARYRDLADLTNLVGHEFNNLLNCVGLQAAALRQKGFNSDRYPELSEIRTQVATAGNMVRRLQEHCQKGNPPRQSADLNRAVRSVVAADSALGERVRLELENDLSLVQGTALDLERLAAGLLRGASAAAPPGAAVVTARTGKGPGTTVWLRVEDAGAEPDNELLPRLFEPFVSVRDGDDGVTLALAKAISRRLGGLLRGEKRVGGGMVFVVELRAVE
jgi:signal transduction histidine kinase